MFRIHTENPGDAVEEAYYRIYRERMSDVPIHNEALSVAAVDFQKWQGHWLGIVLTPWCMSLLLVPGREDGWETPGDNQRRFVKFPAGDFAFLGNVEPELGEFHSCGLFSSMGQFSSQSEAMLTARAALAALFQASAAPATTEEDKKSADEPSLSRRRLFGLGPKK
ncbi:MAG: [NiFe]-hydrogenase assembly chaperone HybE [Rhodocyclaceae bacterium]|nr:[NiFe]-hydrogenase assembly chaperone HybE [Rhodocyclaceae bacterium]